MGHDAIRLKPSQIAAVTAGNALEFYDFVTYAFFATQIGHALFPGDASSKLLLSPMPDYSRVLTVRQLADLLAYFGSLGKP